MCSLFKKLPARLVLLIVLFVLASGLPVQSSEAWALPRGSYFVELLPAPPQPGDAADVSDLDAVLAQQGVATSEEIAHARLTARLDPFEIFSEALGPGFTSEKYPKTKHLLDKLAISTGAMHDEVKAHYARPRPFKAHADAGVVSHVGNEDGFSYPSGHSLRGWLTGLILSELCPEKRAQIMHCGAQVGLDRVIAGVHYHSDVLAARTEGRLIFDKLMDNADFSKELAEVKAAEWRTPPAK